MLVTKAAELHSASKGARKPDGMLLCTVQRTIGFPSKSQEGSGGLCVARTGLIKLADEGSSVRDGQVQVISQRVQLRRGHQVAARQLAPLCKRAQKTPRLFLLIPTQTNSAVSIRFPSCTNMRQISQGTPFHPCLSYQVPACVASQGGVRLNCITHWSKSVSLGSTLIQLGLLQ